MYLSMIEINVIFPFISYKKKA